MCRMGHAISHKHVYTCVQANSLPRVLDWVKKQLPHSLKDTHVPPDWTTIIAAGHSRGGYIAFKQLQQANVVTAALLDAVAPPGAKYDAPPDTYLVVGAYFLQLTLFDHLRVHKKS